MKTLITICMLLACTTLFSQSPKNTKIQITTNMTYDDAYAATGRAIVAAGWEIELADKDFGTIRTARRPFGSFPVYPTTLHANVGTDGQVRLYAIAHDGGQEYNVNMKYKKTWKALLEIGGSIGEVAGYE